MAPTPAKSGAKLIKMPIAQKATVKITGTVLVIMIQSLPTA
jgi:hypothetical protein